MSDPSRDDEGLLTPREAQALDLLRDGFGDEEIAGRLGVSPAAARYHLSQAMAKLGLSSRAEAAQAHSTGREQSARPRFGPSFALPRFRLTPMRAVLLAVVALVAGFYLYSLFLYDHDRVEPIEVRWLPVDLPQSNVREQTRPFRAAAAGAEDMWRVLVVDGNGEPRQVNESHRLMASTVWLSDQRHLVLSLLSRGLSGETLTGYTILDVEAGAPTWESVFPRPFIFLVPRTGGRVALIDQRSGRSDGAVYLIDLDGTTRVMDAPWPIEGAGNWSPGGQWLLVGAVPESDDGPGVTMGSAPGAMNPRYFAVSPDSERAIEVGPLAQVLAWSPDGKRLAGFEGNDLVIFDIEKRRSSRHEVLNAGLGMPPAALFQGVSWSDDGRYVTFSGGLIDARSGRVVVEPDMGSRMTSVSPDGSWLAVSNACPGQPSQSPAAQLSVQTVLKEVSSGHTITVRECALETSAFPMWLSESLLLLIESQCPAPCTLPKHTVSTVSVPAGSSRVINERPVESALGPPFSISPDKRHIALGGDAVRIYTVDGTLLRTIGIPQGMSANGLSWSADGDSLAYVVGPIVTNPFGPPPR